MLSIRAIGLRATIQDVGRSGYAHLGVSHAGAADPDSLRLANRLVGNPESAAAVEFLWGGLAVEFHQSTTFALTGAHVPAELDGRPVPTHQAVYAKAGQTLRTGIPTAGTLSYLGIRGGIRAEPILGSRSTDTLSGIGPPPLAAGDTLEPGPPPVEPPAATQAPLSVPAPGTLIDVAIVWGPRAEWFTSQARKALVSTTWTVSHRIDRIAARLHGVTLEYANSAQLPTEGLHLGSIQVPPSGQPIVHLANHPPTGGYPVIAVVARADVARLAQAEPGRRIRFRSTLPTARAGGN